MAKDCIILAYLRSTWNIIQKSGHVGWLAPRFCSCDNVEQFKRNK